MCGKNHMTGKYINFHPRGEKRESLTSWPECRIHVGKRAKSNAHTLGNSDCQKLNKMKCYLLETGSCVFIQCTMIALHSMCDI